MDRRMLAAAVVVSACAFTPGAPPTSTAPGGGEPTPDGPALSTSDGGWRPLETLTIDSAATTAKSSTTSLAAGVTYRLRVSGSFGCTFQHAPADAEYWDYNHSDYAGTIDFGLGIDDLSVDGTKAPKWGPYSSSHVYEATYVGHGAPLTAVLYDSQYNNNDGSLTLEIFAQD